MSDKKYSPAEAATMVLAKAQELYKTSTLAKGDWAKIHSKLKREGYSEESADKIDGAIKAKMGKSEKPLAKDGMAPPPAPPMPTINQQIGNPFGKSDESGANPDAKADAQLGEKVEQDVHAHEAQNADPAHEAPMKGHIKLAKFIGRMDHKKSLRKGM